MILRCSSLPIAQRHVFQVTFGRHTMIYSTVKNFPTVSPFFTFKRWVRRRVEWWCSGMVCVKSNCNSHCIVHTHITAMIQDIYPPRTCNSPIHTPTYMMLSHTLRCKDFSLHNKSKVMINYIMHDNRPYYTRYSVAKKKKKNPFYPCILSLLVQVEAQ